MTDYSHIPERHAAINVRLEEWSRWVRVKPQGWCVQPMFRMYKAPKQWETDLHVHIDIDTLAAHEVEKAVSALPDKYRSAIRWAYVKPWIPDNKVRAELGLTRAALGEMIHDARSMLINRLK